MKSRPRRRRVEQTDEWEQIELLCGWPEQRDYELGLEGLGEHLPRSLAGDLVEIEHKPFASFIVVVYPSHRCASSSSKSLERRYTTFFKESSIHNF
jgi:hypothetical protein